MKRNGTVRWCLNFRAVNNLTVTDCYPTPNISDILNSLGQSKYFSTLDASQAYNAIPVDPASRPLRTLATVFTNLPGQLIVD